MQSRQQLLDEVKDLKAQLAKQEQLVEALGGESALQNQERSRTPDSPALTVDALTNSNLSPKMKNRSITLSNCKLPTKF